MSRFPGSTHFKSWSCSASSATSKLRGIGILVTDHNVRETLAVTDRAYIISNGRIFRAGSPESLGHDPEVRRIYLR